MAAFSRFLVAPAVLSAALVSATTSPQPLTLTAVIKTSVLSSEPKFITFAVKTDVVSSKPIFTTVAPPLYTATFTGGSFNPNDVISSERMFTTVATAPSTQTTSSVRKQSPQQGCDPRTRACLDAVSPPRDRACRWQCQRRRSTKRTRP